MTPETVNKMFEPAEQFLETSELFTNYEKVD